MPAAPATRPARVNVAKAAAMCGLTPDQLLDQLDQRAALIAGSTFAGRFTANPHPLAGVGGEQVWARTTFQLWALQMGLTKYKGRDLIGYAGIATLFGWKEQSVRARASRDRDQGWPARVTPPPEVVVFDRSEVMEYAIREGILFPDGQPNVNRPHRGNPIRRKAGKS